MKGNLAKRVLALTGAAILALSAAGCGSSAPEGGQAESTASGSVAEGSETEESKIEEISEAAGPEAESLAEEADPAAEISALAAGADQQATGAKIMVAGYEWGPGVPKLVVELPVEAEEVNYDGPLVATAGTERVVTEIYLSDEAGNKLDEGTSRFVGIDLETSYAASGSPFTYDFMVTFMNDWSESYPVQAFFKATVSGAESSFGLDADLIDSRFCPDTDAFGERGEFTGDYENPMTGESENVTLRYAAYMPDELANDGVKNPLIIWLHGQGEGGKDPDITLLGNEVVALAKENIQSRFDSEGGANGAYVLACQTETYWMDGGDGTNSNGDLISRYTEALMDAIKQFVDGHEDIDTDRIYLGGCSNGGYMTMNMLIQYPDYWAAAYPCCEAYSYYMYERNEDGSYKTEIIPTDSWPITQYFPLEERWMSEEKIESIKDIPIWFVQSADDTTVNPASFAMPTYRALLKAGADNCWFSMFETVNGTDDIDGSQYMGHWSWVYIFNDQVTAVQDPEAIKASADDDATFGFAPSNEGGGSLEAEGYRNIFDWLNAQKR